MTKLKKKMAGRPRGGATLPCPVCASRTGVRQTRRNGSGLIERERWCKFCGHSFYSIERPRVLITRQTRERMLRAARGRIEEHTALARLLKPD